MNRIAARSAGRRRVVYSSPPPAVWVAEPDSMDGTRLAARVVRIVRHKTFSPLGATVARPVGDAMATVQILRLK